MERTSFLCYVSVPVVVVVHFLAACLVPTTSIANLTTDQSALLAFRDHVTGNDILTHNWSAATSCCSWIGVTCGGRHHRVTALNLTNMGLTGTITPHLGNLSFLASLNLSYNSFRGHLPDELGYLRRLKYFDLANNNFTGELPLWFGNLTKLQLMYLYENQFYSQIPSDIFRCTQLQFLSLSINKFTGTIPTEIGNLTMLKELYLGGTNLEGTIPHALFNISTIEYISLQFNNLRGHLPSTFGLWLPNLEKLFLSENQLEGEIPSSISNASKLTILELTSNSFTGSIPNTLVDLRLLELLNLDDNFLTTEPSTLELTALTSLTNCKKLTRLGLSRNPLDCMLPTSIGNLSASLLFFYAYKCKIRGSIPIEIGNLSNLVVLSMYDNDFTGFIPATTRGLQKLQVLNVGNNKLQGSIPNDLCHLKSLGGLYLYGNKLSGSIPTCVNNLTSLRYLNLGSNKLNSIPLTLWSLTDILKLNLSTNSLSGQLPVDVGNLKVVTGMDFSRNQFSGDIPSTIGSLQNLIELYLAHNELKGPIPRSFENLVSLELLDVSHNNLSGVIPKTLEALSHLKYLNLSSNRLEGEIPNGGPFVNFSALSFMMNPALCGAAQLQVPPCKTDTHQQSRRTVVPLLKYILPSIASTVLLVALILVLIRRRKGQAKSPSQPDLSPIAWRKFSYHELLQATNGFGESSLLGEGSFGSVYRGILSDGVNVAVKVFNLQLEGAFKSFETECEVLRNIRHRNLIKIISSCTNDDFKCLVLEYMPNGSLEKWLYSPNYCLDILQRINIMIDVASALEYLQHSTSTLVVHCDLKPSNVLLDEDMVAHVGDFGISKLLGEEESMRYTKTLATIGYMAPEYGLEGVVSSRGDVYSFGILLIETFTRKKPTNEMFFGGMSLTHWVKELIPHAVIELVDGKLLSREEEHFVAKKDCIANILELALNCSVDVPQKRMGIKGILATLTKIRSEFQTGVVGTQKVLV